MQDIEKFFFGKEWGNWRLWTAGWEGGSWQIPCGCEAIKLLLVRRMGNSSASSSPLTRHWVRVSPSQLSNSITRELIHEHTLAYPNAQQLALNLPKLQQRISRHHPHIPRVIYFKTEAEDCECGSLSSRCLVLYTEQPGITLGQLRAGNNMKPTLACCCTNLMAGLDYLQDFYGCFQVDSSMVFSNHKDGSCFTSQSVKVWINSKIEESEREKSCTEKQMCGSVRAILLSLGESGQCRLWQHLPRLEEIDTIAQLREEVKFIHSEGFFNKIKIGGHVRVDSASSPTNANFNTNSFKNLNNPQVKSRPVSNSTNQVANTKPDTPKSSQYQGIASKNQWERSSLPTEALVRQTTNDATLAVGNPNNQTMQDLQYRPASTAKINFIYSRESSTNNTKDMSLDSILPYKQQSAPVQRLNFAKKEVVPQIQTMPPVYQNHKGSLDSYNSSPRKMEEQAFQMPVFAEKETPTAKLATTTRSPMKAVDKQGETSRKKSKLQRLGSLHSSGSGRFERYSQAIKQYEQKLKRRLTSSGNRKPDISLQTSGKKLDRMTLNKTSEADFKETKSLYNDSEEDEDRQQARMPVRGQTDELARFEANILRDKRLINEEMEDLMRFNNREEYRIIREKVKQKKQTFAELKAEATKLLEGFSF